MAPRAARLALFVLLGLSAGSADAQLVQLQPTVPQPAAQPQAPQVNRLVKRLGTNQFRHGSRILCLAYAPGGGLLAAGGGADPVRLWDAETGQEKLRLNESWVQALAFTPRGSVLATAGAFKTIRLWEVSTGKELGKLDGHASPVKAMAISPDGTMIASGSQDGVVILWELLTKKQITTLKAHTEEVTSLAFSPDSTLLVSGSADRSVRVWNTDNNKQLHQLDGGCCVQAVAIANDGQTVCSGGDDNLIRLWDADSGKPAGVLQGHEGFLCSLVVSRDGKTLLSGARDGTIRTWDVAQQKQTGLIRRNAGDSDALALSKDGKLVATAGINNTIRIFDRTTGKELTQSDVPQAGLGTLALSADGKRLVTAASTGVVYVWDALAGRITKSWSCPQAGEMVVALSPDGKVVVTGSDSLRAWDADAGTELAVLPTKPGEFVVGLTFSPDGKTLAVGLRNGHVTLWDWPNRKPREHYDYTKPAYALAFARDGSQLAVAGGSKIALLDPATAKEIKSFESKEGQPGTAPDVATLAFAPDGKTLAAACYDAVVRLYDLGKGKEARACEGHVSVPYGLAFTSDGRTLLSAAFDGTVRSWESFSGKEIATMQGHAGPVYGVAISPDNRTAYSASADTNVIVWDVTGQLAAAKGEPTAADLEQAWRDLASESAPAANVVAWRLIAHPKQAMPFLTAKVYLQDVARIRKLLKDLDSDDFEERNKANTELQGHGRWIEGRLREALVMPPSLEYKRRIEQLLEKLNVPGSLSLRQEQLRLWRVMMVLEQVADAESLSLFDKLTRQAPEDRFAEEAKTSLARLNGRRGGS